MQEYKKKALEKNIEVCTGVLTKQLSGSPSVVTIPWKSQYKSSLRHYMQVYTFQREEKETKTSQQQLQSQILLLMPVRVTSDGKAK